MNSFYFSSAALHLHMIFVGVTFVGGILFISWALKMKADEIKRWTLWLLVVGILGVLVTSGFSGLGWRMKYLGGDKMMKEGYSMMNGQVIPGMMQNR